MFRFLILFGIALPAAVYGQLAVQQCSGLRPLPLTVIVPGCDELPCDIKSGGVAEAQITFTVGAEDAHYINPSIFADLGDDERVYFEIPEEYQYGCNQLIVGECPLASGVTAVYNLAIPFDSQLGAGNSITMQFTLYDDNENTLACFRAPINIV